MPASASVLDARHLRLRHDRHTAMPRAANEADVQAVHVDVARVGLEKGAGDIVAPQNRHQSKGLIECDAMNAWHEGARLLERVLEKLELIRARNREHAARRKE